MSQTPNNVGLNRAKFYQLALFPMNNGATNVYFVLILSFIATFGNKVLGLAMVFASFMITGMRVFDAITDPIIGALMDKTNTKFGKFRPFMVIGNGIMAVSVILLYIFTPMIPEGAMWLRYTLFVLLYAVWVIGYTFQTSVTRSAQPVLTNDPKQRPLFTVFNTIGSLLGMGVVQVLGMVIASDGIAGDYNRTWFGIMTPVGIAISVGLTVLAIIGIWEKDNEKYFGIGGKQEPVKVREYIQIIGRNKPLQRLMVAGGGCKLALAIATNLTVLCMLYGCMTQYTTSMALVHSNGKVLADVEQTVSFDANGNAVIDDELQALINETAVAKEVDADEISVKEVGKNRYDSLNATMMVLGYVFSAPFFALTVRTSQKYGQKRSLMTYVGVALASYVGVLVLLLLWKTNTPALNLTLMDNGKLSINLYTIAFILFFGIGYGAYYATADMPIPMVADCADYETYCSGKFIPGIMGTLFSLVDKLVSSLASTVVTVALLCVGISELPTKQTPFVAGMQPVVIAMFCIVPMLAWGATLWAMKGYTLTGAKMKEIQAVNNARKQGIAEGLTMEQAMQKWQTMEDVGTR